MLAEATAILAVRPDLIVEALADGAKDNWTFLSKEVPKIVPEGTTIIETLDFFHGAEHLEEALTACYGERSKKRSAQFEKLRHILRHAPGTFLGAVPSRPCGVEWGLRRPIRVTDLDLGAQRAGDAPA